MRASVDIFSLLEKKLWEKLEWIGKLSPATHDARAHSVMDLLDVVRATQREFNQQARCPTCLNWLDDPAVVHSENGCGPRSQRDFPDVHVPWREHGRVYAWEKWAKEVAVPALESCERIHPYGTAMAALATRPKE